MSRFRHTDILVELIELCHERRNEVRQQLTYYRASVYKDEMSRLIQGKIDALRVVADLFGDVLLAESFTDFDAMAKVGVVHYIPGECSFSKRVSMLLSALDGHLSRLSQQMANRALPTDEAAFTDAVRQHRTQLLALCRQGSHQWTFFESL